MLLLWLINAAFACPADPEDVSLRAHRALSDHRVTLLPVLLADVQCLDGWMTPDGAVALHRLIAMERWQTRDVAMVAAHLRSTPNDGWRPSDPGLAKIAQSSRGTESQHTEAIAIPPGWKAVLDGKLSTLRPLDRAVVFQWVDPQGTVRRTQMLPPTQAMPAPPVRINTELADAPQVTPWAGEPENLMLLGGIATAVVASTLVVAGAATRGGLPDPAGGPADPDLRKSIEKRTRRANALGYVGQGTGVAAIGLIVTSRVVFR